MRQQISSRWSMKSNIFSKMTILFPLTVIYILSFDPTEENERLKKKTA